MSQAGIASTNNIPPPPGSITDLQGQDGITVPPNGSGIIFVQGTVVAAGTTPFTTTGNAGTSTETWSIQRSQAAALSAANIVGLAAFNSSEFTVDANGFVSLAGGGLAVDSFAMQTGTSPVVPTAAGLVTFNGAVVANGVNPVRTDGTGANTMALEVQISAAIAATDATRIGLSAFNSAQFTVDANGFVSSTQTDLHITPFIVSAAGIANGASFTTIQSAVDAAFAAGGGIVYVQPGTYVENVTMRENVNLVGMVGSSGNIVYSLSGGETLPVIIQGNFTLNLLTASVTPTVELNNITFTANAGVVFTLLGNIGLLESGFITFTNSQLVAGTAPTFIFSVDGFFNVNLNSSEVSETTPDSTNFITWGATPFLNLNARNSYININATTALTIPTGCFNVFTIQNTSWNSRLDASTGIQTLNFTAINCTFSPTAAADSDPLINFGANDGSLIATNCQILGNRGNLANSTSVSAASVFRFNNCIWNNPITLGANGRGEFVYCEIYGGASPAITFSSAQAISLLHCTVNSSHNPAIAGAGAGVITYDDVIFVGNGSFAGTLTLATTFWRPYSIALAATDGSKVGTCNFNSAQFSVDTSGFVSLLGGGQAIDSIMIDGNTAPGTNPVLPTVAGLVTITGTQVAAGTTVNAIRTFSLAANSFEIQVQRTQAVASSTVGDNGVAHFNSANFSVDSNGFVSSLIQAFNYTSVNFAMSPYTVLATDYFISVDSSGGSVVLNFPNAPTFKHLYVIKDRTGNAATNPITLTTPGGTVTFDGVTSYTLNSNYQAVNLVANATPTYEVF